MRILLDSHAFFWWAVDDRRYSRAAHDAMMSGADVYVSSVIAWEISGKVRTGKWPEATPLAERFLETVRHYRMRPLPISLEHALLAGSLPAQHRDPFDRMLAAQAITEGMPLVTADPAFKEFEVQILW